MTKITYFLDSCAGVANVELEDEGPN